MDLSASLPPRVTAAVVVQDILMSSNICELDEGCGEGDWRTFNPTSN